LASNNWTIILFLVVYGMDSFLTLGHRLLLREKISLPHRTHLYQIIANQLKKDHVLISLIYGVLQLGVNLIFFILPQSYPDPLIASLVLIASAGLYLAIKIPLVKKYKVYGS
jgi:hypothetical protein